GIGAHHGNADTFLEMKDIAPFGDLSPFGGQPASNRIVFIIVQMGIKGLIKVMDISQGHDAPAIVAGLKYGLLGLLVKLILDVANNLLEHILHRDQPSSATVLVNNDGNVVAAHAKFS